VTAVSKTTSAIDDIAVGRKVLTDEAAGLMALAEILDAGFIRAVDLLAAARGRVVVSGMGKSGHVARKIAATLSSTGTPALYVNAAEASHGDLGMIAAEDAVLALSKSGETPELEDLVAHTKLREIPLIAITGRAGSSLDVAADVSLTLPDTAEACPLDLAPTTSTTVMMALGDALAVALLERHGFSPEEFGALHPGGQLGRRFLRVGDIMHRGADVPLIDGAEPMTEALINMTAKSFGCVGITNADDHLIGIITDGDLRRHMDNGLLARAAREVMTESPKTISADALAAGALALMKDRQITSLFVVENRSPVGILHIHDLLRAGIV
jgi:arabinose-5-phosphate isomerase